MVQDFMLKKESLDWDEVFQKSHSLDEGKRAELTPLSVLDYDVKNHILKLGSRLETGEITETAFNQFLRLLKIPASYYNSCSTELKEKEIKEGLEKLNGEKNVIFKFKENLLYGIVPEVYNPYTTTEYLDLISKNIPVRLTVKEIQSSLEETRLRTVLGEGTNLGLYKMIDFRFSEIGTTKFEIEPGVFRYSCENGLMLKDDVTSVTSFSMNKFDSDLVKSNLSITDRKVERSLETYVQVFEDLNNIPITTDEEYKTVFACCLQDRGQRKALDSVIKDFYDTEGIHNVYGVVNGVTRCARDSAYQVRVRLEKYAGSFVHSIKQYREQKSLFASDGVSSFSMDDMKILYKDYIAKLKNFN